MKQTTKNNPHGWLFKHLQSICDADEIDETRKALVYEYSGGKTESLSELYKNYPKLYAKMYHSITSRQSKKPDPLDIHRKRLMAAIFERLEDQGNKGASFDYVKAVACNAAQVQRFNDIPLPTLKSLYRKFGEKNLDKYETQVNELIKSVL